MNKAILLSLILVLVAGCASKPVSDSEEFAANESGDSVTAPKRKKVCESTRASSVGSRLDRSCRWVIVDEEEGPAQ